MARVIYKDDQVVIYSDVSFTPEYYDLSVNAEAVMGSIVNILTTIPGERLNRPTFGCDIESLLFDLMDYVTAQAIFTQVYRAITQWEPRVKLNAQKSNVIPNFDYHYYELSLYFYIVGLKTEFNVRRFYKQKSMGLTKR